MYHFVRAYRLSTSLSNGTLGSATLLLLFLGLKVFMDAHKPVTLEEGDRYPLGPPSYVSVVLTAARQSPKLLVGVQIPPGTPI